MEENTNNYSYESKPCLFEYLNSNKNLYIEPNPFIRLLSDSISFEYFWGVKLQTWKPHKDVEWRIMPYITLVYVGNCNPQYYIHTKKTGCTQVFRDSVVVFQQGESFKFELLDTAQLSNAHITFSILGHIDMLSLFEVPYIINGDSANQIGRILNDLAVQEDENQN